MKIKVRKRDIKDGRPNDCYICPIALAVERHLKASIRVAVADQLYLWVNGDSGPNTRIDLPVEVTTFIELYDSYTPVEPFTFKLKIPKAMRQKA